MRRRRSREPRGVSRRAVEAIHADQIVAHGGLAGLRDSAALDAALGRPRDKWGYGTKASLPVLAAAYAFGVARNHPFNDGNKRTAFLTMVAFLGLNGVEFDAPEEEVVAAFTGLAAGAANESKLARWIAKRAEKPRRS